MESYDREEPLACAPPLRPMWRLLGRRRGPALAALIAAAALVAAACAGGDSGNGGGTRLSGTIEMAGSSTVFPIAEAWAEEFGLQERRVRVNVASIGSGAGFQRFCNGETDISNASRPIKPSEVERCGGNGVAFIEIPVAFDGLSVVVNVENDWVDFLTVAELARIFGPTDFAKRWSEVRPTWPEERIGLFSPGADSGTFDYFTDEINGAEDVQRTENTQFSEDDNVLVQGVAGETGGIGYFGFAFLVNNADKIRAVPIDPGTGGVSPSIATIADGSYRPLSRPLFIYVTVESLARPEVQAFVEWALDANNGRRLVDDPTVGYVQLPDAVYAASLARVRAGQATGSLHLEAPAGATLEEVFVP